MLCLPITKRRVPQANVQALYIIRCALLMKIPVIQAGAMSASQPHRAEAEEQRALGFPEQQPKDWQARAVKHIGELVANSRSLQIAMDACMHCGACTDKCH